MCRHFLYAALICIVLSACAGKDGFAFHDGDLVFRVADVAGMSAAVAASTAWDDSLKFDHVGIVTIRNGSPVIIEATSSGGVKYTSLDDFLQASVAFPSRGRGVVVMRVNMDFPLAMAVERAIGYIGQEYDWHFLPDNGKLYCSELVWECYRWDDGTRLFPAAPMNFRDKDGNMPEFWEELFRKYGEPVPEGVPGTNPNDIAKSDALAFAYKFF